jgi:hypothetical protein
MGGVAVWAWVAQIAGCGRLSIVADRQVRDTDELSSRTPEGDLQLARADRLGPTNDPTLQATTVDEVKQRDLGASLGCAPDDLGLIGVLW